MVDRGAVRGVHLAGIVAAATQPAQVVVAEIRDEITQRRLGAGRVHERVHRVGPFLHLGAVALGELVEVPVRVERDCDGRRTRKARHDHSPRCLLFVLEEMWVVRLPGQSGS